MSISKLNQSLGNNNVGFTSVKEQLKETMPAPKPAEPVAETENQEVEAKPVEKAKEEKKTATKRKKPMERTKSARGKKSRFTRAEKKTVTKSFSIGRYVVGPLEQEADEMEMSVSQLLTDILSERYYGKTIR